MDPSDQISRRDAVIGVSFLGALMLALSATIIYRIVESEPRKPRSFSEPIFAAAQVAGDAASAPRVDESIEAASFEAPDVSARRNDVDVPAMPTFVAPSSTTGASP
jgi:hypothetical protein